MPIRYKPRVIEDFTWSPQLAYIVGLLVTDGCLSSNRRHVIFTSKDLEQINNFKSILKLKNKIGLNRNRHSEVYRIQIGNVQLYDWLVSIGFSPRKSLTIKEILVPDIFFRDFLRGHLDGDGSIIAYADLYNTKVNPKYVYKRLWVKFISASNKHIEWLHNKIEENLNVKGAIHVSRVTIRHRNPIYIIKFGKKESLKLLSQLYYKDDIPCLSRKKEIYLNFIKEYETQNPSNRRPYR